MPDKKKVIRGLVACGCLDGVPDICGIMECPYKHPGECMHQLARDALALLRDSVSAELFLEVLRKYEISELCLISEYSCDTKAAEANLKKELEKLKKKAGIN